MGSIHWKYNNKVPGLIKVMYHCLYYLLGVHSYIGDGSDGLENVAQDVEEGDVNDRLELPQELVSDPGSQDRCEVTEAGECVIDCSGLVLREAQLFLQIQRQDGLHAIVRKSLAELVSHNEENTEGIPQLEQEHIETFNFKWFLQ